MKPVHAPTQPERAPRPALRAMVAAVVLGIATLSVPAALAASTDIANQPLATRPTVGAKPNLMFILDDSGSMASAYMPDDIGNNDWRGYYSAQCNGLAFDPTLEYLPPVKADGSSYANASFTAARADGYEDASWSNSAADLSNSVYYEYTGTQQRMGWVYTRTGVVNNDFLTECKTSTAKSDSADALFKPVVVTSSSSVAQKYANWYSYYRKRYLLMRTAVGQAFKPLDSNFRVGFSRINKDTIEAGANFRDVRDFDAQHKTDFYSSLYGAEPSGWTPLRSALSKAGRYFAKKATTNQSYDPVQYSCQRNIALLSTDGYWNKSYGVDLNGSNVGQHDGAEPRPVRDDAQVRRTEEVTHTAPATRSKIVTSTETKEWTRRKTIVSSTTGNGCSKYRRERQDQERVDTRVSRTTTPQSGVATYKTTSVWVDGELVLGPTDGDVSYGSWINTPGGTTTSEGPTVTAGTWIDDGPAAVDCTSTKGDGEAHYDNEDSDGYESQGPATEYSSLATGAYKHGEPKSTTTSSNGTPNTLADVAQYYYKTDLRTEGLGNCTSGGVNVCPNSVKTVGADTADWQHMNTYTVGMGVSGTLPYSRDYLTQTTGTYADLKAGRLYWPQPEGYNTGSGEGGDATNVDDLWHAAVNGRGQYYSALNASSLADAIKGVVNEVSAAPGAAAAAATSSVDLVVGDSNQVFRASYTTVSWTGELEALSIDGTTGTISSTPIWSAQALLDVATPSARKIYFNGGGSLAAFTFANMSAAQKAYFSNICLQAGQCADLEANDKTEANKGANLVNYLRGDTTYESPTSGLKALYRDRKHILGDLINGAPVRVGKPPFSYGDSGYADFVASKADRKPVVYVAANDGMLHAFSADDEDGGTELWAYVPTVVMPKLYKLADKNYGTNHQYYVDGAPVMADIKVGNTWKTILVGGLGAGGAAYYALDITDPENPSLLWEFTDANLGLSLGNPVIGKRPSDGSWVVAFASGYNNTAGDGLGRLYVLNANTGAPVVVNGAGDAVNSIATSAGSSTTPSGLAKINAWVTSRSNNTIERIYGGDLEGNLWRFDIDNQVAPHLSALRLAKFQTNATTPQSITTKPEVAKIGGKVVVMVGTGRFLGLGDIDTTTQQSVYAIKDNLTATGWGDVRANTTDFVQQTLTLTSATSASITDLSVDWASKGGWWVDLPNQRERVATNMALLGGVLMVGTAIPDGDACTTGGSSWFYGLDAVNGGVVNKDTPAGQQWSDTALIAGQTLVRDALGNRKNLVTDTEGNIRTQDVAGTTSGLGSARRSSWRELIK